ncbi:MAG TPA: hypothetical protein VMI56_23780 [Reyranella sp.]|nr:hypothetical protein [Reyranella sp.]
MSARPSRLPYLLWPAFALLILAAGAVLLPACGLSMPAVPRTLGWNFCPAEPPALRADTAEADHLRRTIATLEKELGDKHLACAVVPAPPLPPLELPREAGPPQPQQTAALKPPTPPQPQPLPENRWNRKDLTLLQGCWLLGREVIVERGNIGAANRETNCVQKSAQLCFDDRGHGQYEQVTTCPISGTARCSAPVQASFGDDRSLVATRPQAACQPQDQIMLAGTFTCRRIDDTHAVCRRHVEDSDFADKDMEFYRKP